MKIPSQIEHWTADEVAECVDYKDASIYRKLWRFVAEAENPTPLGGDGSNGTVETPDGRLDPENDDKCPHWWNKLTEEEQRKIADAL